jgi:queuine tRNA-ribosyltransferase
MFDSVLPTRLARHGTILTSKGRLNIGNAEHARSELPLDPECGCVVCATWSRAYLRHLHSVGEPGVARLFTLHNLSWVLGLVAKARDAIREGRLPRLRAELVDVWGA